MNVISRQAWYTGEEPLTHAVRLRDGTFRNPWSTFTERGVTDILRWKLLDCETHAPKFPTVEEASVLLPTVESIDWATINRFEIHKEDKKKTQLMEPTTETTAAASSMPSCSEDKQQVPAHQVLSTTWCGHASFLVQHGGVNILTDPVWSQRASPVQFAGPKRMVPAPMRIDALPRIHIVTISHNHFDHLDSWTVKELILRHDHPIFIVPLKMKSRWFASLPAESLIELDRVVELDWWERVSLSAEQVFRTKAARNKKQSPKDLQQGVEGNSLDQEDTSDHGEGGVKVQVTGVPVQHWTMRTGMDRYHELWCGFVIDVFTSTSSLEHEQDEEESSRRRKKEAPVDFRRIFHAGDTGYCTVFGEIGRALGPMDLSLIPIGAYAPRYVMNGQHVDPPEAVQIHLDVRSKTSVGMHWGTFILTDEPVDEPPKLLRQALAARGIPPSDFRALKHGETIRL